METVSNLLAGECLYAKVIGLGQMGWSSSIGAESHGVDNDGDELQTLEVWHYQTLEDVADMQRGIEANTSLSELLNAARTEHPLRDRSNLEGTPWDTTGIPKGAER